MKKEELNATGRALLLGSKILAAILLIAVLLTVASRKREDMRREWIREWRNRPYWEQKEPTWFERFWYGVEKDFELPEYY